MKQLERKIQASWTPIKNAEFYVIELFNQTDGEWSEDPEGKFKIYGFKNGLFSRCEKVRYGPCQFQLI